MKKFFPYRCRNWRAESNSLSQAKQSWLRRLHACHVTRGRSTTHWDEGGHRMASLRRHTHSYWPLPARRQRISTTMFASGLEQHGKDYEGGDDLTTTANLSLSGSWRWCHPKLAVFCWRESWNHADFFFCNVMRLLLRYWNELYTVPSWTFLFSQKFNLDSRQ